MSAGISLQIVPETEGRKADRAEKLEHVVRCLTEAQWLADDLGEEVLTYLTSMAVRECEQLITVQKGANKLPPTEADIQRAYMRRAD